MIDDRPVQALSVGGFAPISHVVGYPFQRAALFIRSYDVALVGQEVVDELGETFSQHPYQSIIALHPYQYISYGFSAFFENRGDGLVLSAILEQPGFWL